MKQPTLLQAICHNIVTAINGNDSDGNLSFDVNLLHASPVADSLLTEILEEYRILLYLPQTAVPYNQQSDLRDLWGPIKFALSEIAYRPVCPTVNMLNRFISSFVGANLYVAAAYLGRHPNRIARLTKITPGSGSVKDLAPIMPTFAYIICAEEIGAAHAAIFKTTNNFHPEFTIPLLNADEFRVMCERYANGVSF